MAAQIHRSAPIAIVTVVAAYCCWPYAGSPAREAAPRADSRVEITPALLAPAVEPASERDPFRLPNTVSSQVKPAEKPDKAAPSPTAAAPAAHAMTAAELTGGLVLNATCIRGQHRIAFINGRAYAEGEPLSGESAGTPPCTVAQVYPDKVLLRYLGRQVELTYSNVEARAGPRSPAAKPDNARARLAGRSAPPKGTPPARHPKPDESTTDPEPSDADDQHTAVDH